jgi:hypothetical protein
VGGCGCVNGPWHPHSGTAMHTCMLATCAALSLIAVGVAGGHQSHALGADIQDLGKKTTQRRRAHGPSVGFLSEGLSGGDSRVGHERWRRASTTLEPTTGSGELDRLSHLSTVADTRRHSAGPKSMPCLYDIVKCTHAHNWEKIELHAV